MLLNPDLDKCCRNSNAEITFQKNGSRSIRFNLSQLAWSASTLLLTLLAFYPHALAQPAIEIEFEAGSDQTVTHPANSNPYQANRNPIEPELEMRDRTQSSNPSQNEDVRYYQDYQPAPIPPSTAPSSVPIRAAQPRIGVSPDNSVLPATTLPYATPTAAPMEFGTPLPQANPRTVSTNIPSAPTDPPNWGVVIPIPSNPQNSPDRQFQAAASEVSPLPGTAADLVVPVTDLQVAGVSQELQQIALQTIQTRPGGNTSQLKLQDDVRAILQTGLFARARVSSTDNPNGISVLFQVEPTIVRSLNLVGAQILPLEVANASFQSQLGVPISPTLLNQGAENINRWYAENGYSLAQVIAVRPGQGNAVTIEVAEGVVDNIAIRFTDKDGETVDKKGRPIKGRTRESFLRREIQLKPGQTFSQQAIQADIERLSKLGLFNRVEASLETEAGQTTVVYNLSEVRSRSVNFGGGVATGEGVFGTANYRDINVGGIGQQFETAVRASSLGPQGNIRFVSPYRDSQPNRLGYEVNGFRSRLLSDTFDDRVRLPNDDRVREGRFGGGFAFMRPVNKDWDGRLGFNYTRVSIRDSEGDLFTRDELGNPLTVSGTGIDDLAILSFGVSQDRRDNPANPSRGSRVRLSTEQSIPVGRGDIIMNRLRADYAQYIPVRLFSRNNPRPENPEVFAVNVQGGTAIGELPPYEAFNLGGFDSVRGYGEDDVGSGRSFFLLSGEYRFPIVKWLGGVLFTDFATDLGSGDTVLGEPAEVRDKPGTGFGVGAGVRILSPVGLLRVDLGFSDEGESRLRFGFGQRF